MPRLRVSRRPVVPELRANDDAVALGRDGLGRTGDVSTALKVGDVVLDEVDAVDLTLLVDRVVTF